MPVNAKPFDASQKIYKRKFLGKPAIYSAQDINQLTDVFNTHLEQLSNNVGMIRYNWKVNIRLDLATLVGTDKRYQSEISLLKVNNAEPTYVYFRGVRFDIPVGNIITYVGDWTDADKYPVGYLVLLAQRVVTTFSDDSAIGGITSSEYPQALPSSDAYVYKYERLVYVDSVANVSLQAGEEVIGIIASVIPEDASDVVVTVATPTVPSVVTFTNAVRRVVLYHAVLASELMDFLVFEEGDNIMKELGFISSVIITQNIENNGSLNETIMLLKQYMQRKMRFVELGFRGLQGSISVVLQNLAGVLALIAQVQQDIIDLKKRQEIPIGAIIEWHGPIDLFDTKGTGKVGTPVENFQICNGVLGTPDRRGRFPVMAINVPNEGAPSLAAAVDPANALLPAGSNPSYNVGQFGGEAVHKLTIPELPAHKHEADTSADDTLFGKFTVGASAPEGVVPLETKATGGDVPHNNLPPYYVTLFIKRYK